ncbi:MAG: hypothetical protein JOZ99_04440 [Actinobacteria bacterium]|nr:hypothetical protein [Actinomycetota bacterium]
MRSRARADTQERQQGGLVVVDVDSLVDVVVELVLGEGVLHGGPAVVVVVVLVLVEVVDGGNEVVVGAPSPNATPISVLTVESLSGCVPNDALPGLEPPTALPSMPVPLSPGEVVSAPTPGLVGFA